MERTFTMTKQELNRVLVIKRIENKEITQLRAAEYLAISERQFRRVLKRYRAHGETGVISQKRGRPSNRRLEERVIKEATELIGENYPDFGPTLAKEKLQERHDIKLSKETVRKLMIANKLWTPRKRKEARIHQRRTRRSQEGDLVQMDGSEHDWFEGRASRCTLLVAIDDATSKIKKMRFAKAESTESYYKLVREYIEEHGLPRAFYTDKHSVFRVNHKTARRPTQFHRALKELDIQLICANSPQAKGRVERANGTLQDRLIKEMRLRGISGIDEGNRYIEEFTKEYNKKFGHQPKDPEDGHRKLDQEVNLSEVLANHEIRSLSKNLTFQYSNVIYQIETDRPYSMRYQKVEVIESPKQEVKIKYQNKELKYSTYVETSKQPEISNGKDLHAIMRKPRKRHPWRR